MKRFLWYKDSIQVVFLALAVGYCGLDVDILFALLDLPGGKSVFGCTDF